MTIHLLRTQRGVVIARTSLMELLDGEEDSYEIVAVLNIDDESCLTADHPDLQKLLNDAFVSGAKWGQKNPQKYISHS
ncbi:MAG: hypothetical protein P1P90_01760 [Patescibacteria group bacterium]|nr:hypothetical protein [Patescibacteria group bacterium]